MKRFCIVCLGTFLAVSCIYANPTPGPWSEMGFSVMQTLELIAHAEYPIFKDSTGTIVFYGGPTGVYIWSPSDLRSFGAGAEAGVELRRYLGEPFTGGFLSVYGGGGRLWRFGEENIWSLSMGLKFGTRDLLLRSFVDVDLEPYLALGIRLAGSKPVETETDHYQFTVYLGTKLDIF